jgi:hypothetical protein
VARIRRRLPATTARTERASVPGAAGAPGRRTPRRIADGQQCGRRLPASDLNAGIHHRGDHHCAQRDRLCVCVRSACAMVSSKRLGSTPRKAPIATRHGGTSHPSSLIRISTYSLPSPPPRVTPETDNDGDVSAAARRAMSVTSWIESAIVLRSYLTTVPGVGASPVLRRIRPLVEAPPIDESRQCRRADAARQPGLAAR